MGWTSYIAKNYKNGKIDKKAEMDEELQRYGDTKVLYSTMKGNTYYAAIQYGERVCGMVCLIKTNGWEFAYKDMDESMGPYAYDAPKKLIDMLSPTDNECALEWRKKCLEKKEKTIAQQLNELPEYTEIKYKTFGGQEAIAYKHPASFQFKKAFWYIPSRNQYISPKYIETFEIVKAV